MADKLQGEPSPKKKKILPIVWVVVIIVVAALAGAGARYWQLDRAAKKAATPSAVQRTAQYDTQNSVAAGDYDGAHKQLEKALDNSHLSKDDKYTLVAQQGTTYEAQKDYANALKKYQEADTIKPTQDVAESIGRVAEAQGNKDLAISSYKKATARIAADNPVGEADKDRYGQLIRNLGGQP